MYLIFTLTKTYKFIENVSLCGLISHQFSEVLVDVDLVAVVVVDGRQPQVEEVVVVMEGAELEQRDDGTVVVVTFAFLVLKLGNH